MQIKQFIEKTIEGGWQGWKKVAGHMQDMPVIISLVEKHMLHETLLDPLAWQAVGKVEEWGMKPFKGSLKESMGRTIFIGLDSCEISECQYKMHQMIDTLAEASNKPGFDVGKTIEEYLLTLFKK